MVSERFVKAICGILGCILFIFAVLLMIASFNVVGHIFLLLIIGIALFIWWKQGKLTKANASMLVSILFILLLVPIIAEFKPNLLLWAKTHMFVILLGVCVTSALTGIFFAFLSLYWGKYGSKIFKGAERGSFKYFVQRFTMPLVFFMLSFIFLGDIGELTKQAWLENICLVGTEIAIIGFILYFILRKLGKIPHR